MKKTISILLLFLLQTVCFGQLKKAFPTIAVETLTNQKKNLPTDVKGKYTLIGVAYSQKSEADLKTWYEPTYQTFFAQTGNNNFVPTNAYDINMYFIIMINGLKQAAEGKIIEEIKKGTAAKHHKNIVTFAGNIKDYKESMSLGKKDDPTFFLLDKKGVVVYMAYGACDNGKLDAIIDILDEE